MICYILDKVTKMYFDDYLYYSNFNIIYLVRFNIMEIDKKELMLLIYNYKELVLKFLSNEILF